MQYGRCFTPDAVCTRQAVLEAAQQQFNAAQSHASQLCAEHCALLPRLHVTSSEEACETRSTCLRKTQPSYSVVFVLPMNLIESI